LGIHRARLPIELMASQTLNRQQLALLSWRMLLYAGYLQHRSRCFDRYTIGVRNSFMTDQSQHPTEEKTSDLKSLLNHMEENPLLYIGSFVFLVVIALAGFLFRLNTSISNEADASKYAFALDEETAAARSLALAEVADSDSAYSIEALYLSGINAFEANDYATAIETLTRIQTDHAGFQFAPDAVSIIGLSYEAQGEFDSAISEYESVQTTWPDSFAARVQSNNLGRCYEEQDKIAEAISAYEDQISGFPGSREAARAQNNLNRLRAFHPEAFEVEEVADDLSVDALSTEEPAADELGELNINVQETPEGQ